MKTNRHDTRTPQRLIAQTSDTRPHWIKLGRSAARLVLAGLLALVIGSAATQAFANDTFYVHNNSNSVVHIWVYTGKDSWCTSPEHHTTIDSGKDETFHCKGQGAGRCKIHVNGSDSTTICKNISDDTCGDSDIHTIQNEQTLTITGGGDDPNKKPKDTDYTCTVSGGLGS